MCARLPPPLRTDVHTAQIKTCGVLCGTPCLSQELYVACAVRCDLCTHCVLCLNDRKFMNRDDPTRA